MFNESSKSTSTTASPKLASMLELEQWSEQIEKRILQIASKERVRRIDEILRELDRLERATIDDLADQYQDRTAQSLSIIQRVRTRWQAARAEATLHREP